VLVPALLGVPVPAAPPLDAPELPGTPLPEPALPVAPPFGSFTSPVHATRPVKASANTEPKPREDLGQEKEFCIRALVSRLHGAERRDGALKTNSIQ
jgi:hypothetical protein